MIWNHTDKSELKMKNLQESEIIKYLNKIEPMFVSLWVYQIEASGRNLFEYIKGDEDSIMGLPIKNYEIY